MQTNGIGNSHSDMHHVTNCIHNHKHRLEGQVGGAGSAGGDKTVAVTSAQPESTAFSLSAWLQDAFSGAKGLLRKIWGSDADKVSGEATMKSGAEIPTDMNHLHRSQIEAATTIVQPVQSVNNNPYFAALTEESVLRQSVWHKIRVRFRDITGFLTKRFSFAGGGTFQAKQERPKEDLRKHSRYRENDVEMDCVLTDESYLMDSYNKKGEYSKLSAGK